MRPPAYLGKYELLPYAERALHPQPDRVLIPVLAIKLAFYYLLFPYFITPSPKEKTT